MNTLTLPWRRLGGIGCLCGLALALSLSHAETLYNGIELPSPWPPRDQSVTDSPLETPSYLLHPPAVIPIDIGRQLFVDSFLVEETNLRREFHAAEPYVANPVITPDRPWEKEGLHDTAMAFSDGVWYDPADATFKAWYVGGGNHGTKFPDRYTMYARSPDGVHWTKPELDVRPGTNIVHVGDRDSAIAWLDLEEKDPARRFKFAYSTGAEKPAALYYSADGTHWGQEVMHSPPTGDRFTAFWNPFRRVWVANLRTHLAIDPARMPNTQVRVRAYHEGPDLVAALSWKPDTPSFEIPAGGTPPGAPVLWTGADRLDHMRPELGTRPQLYALDAVAYESIMLGLFSVWRGQPDRNVREKPNQISVGYSRDGFHWSRPSREPLVAVSERPEAWNNGNVQSVGGCCLVVGDRLYFYHSGRQGGVDVHGVNSTGLAFLRRDGFVSQDAPGAEGSLTTRAVRFSGRHLFVNADSSHGELRVEVLDRQNRVIAPFSAAHCLPISSDNTLQAVRWEGGADLSALAGQPVKFRFLLKYGSLYSFWVSSDPSGASHGYVAAGGPGFTGPTDTVGADIYKVGFSATGLK